MSHHFHSLYVMSIYGTKTELNCIISKQCLSNKKSKKVGLEIMHVCVFHT